MREIRPPEQREPVRRSLNYLEEIFIGRRIAERRLHAAELHAWAGVIRSFSHLAKRDGLTITDLSRMFRRWMASLEFEMSAEAFETARGLERKDVPMSADEVVGLLEEIAESYESDAEEILDGLRGGEADLH